MKRQTLIEIIRREVYNGQVSDDAEITVGLVNQLINEAIPVAVKTSYVENLKMDGIAYVNNSFYITLKDLTITKDDIDAFVFKITLPEIPIGLGANEGIAQLIFRDATNYSLEAVPLNMAQVSYRRNIRRIPNKVYYWNETNTIFCDTVLNLRNYKAIVKMVGSGNELTDITSEINLPPEWISFVQDYVVKNLMLSRQQKQDVTSDGLDQA